LTVSPKNLGTSLYIEASLTFDFKNSLEGDKESVEEIMYARHIKVEDRLAEPN